MYKKLFHIFLTFLFVNFFGQEIVQLKVDRSLYAGGVNSPIPELYGSNVSSDETEVKPTINAELNVNAQGALTYNIPIEVFKGVNNFQPNLSLSYSSDGGNGQAGYGWNIVGLSSITRGGKSKSIDGIYEGPQFDESDPYYLDGQRLIGFNEENPDTAVTESFSTIKVTKINEGNYKFKVQYPDGKIAKYVSVAPRQYAIGVISDANDNDIVYNYIKENNTSYLKSISYGKTTGTHPFKITFEREKKQQPIKAYRNGLAYINDKILKSIVVSSNQEGDYRKYILTHDISSLGQERLRFVNVENGDHDRLKTLKFNYSDKSTYQIEHKHQYNAGLTSNTETIVGMTMGDFYGDGEISSVYYLEQDKAGSIVSSKKGAITQFNKDENVNIFNIYAGKIINHDGTVSKNDQLLTIKEITEGITIINDTKLNYQKITFEAYDLISKVKSLKSISLTQGFSVKEDRNGIDCEESIYPYMYVPVKNPQKYIVGDFNSDGLVDVIIKQSEQKGLSAFIDTDESVCNYNIKDFKKIKERTFFIEIGKIINSDSEDILQIDNFEYNGENLKDLEYYPIEFDGDGFPEILQLDKDKGEIDVLKINHKTKSFDVVLSQFKLLEFKKKTPLVFGDYNGDGLTDFLTPRKIYELNQKKSNKIIIEELETDQSYIWDQYISTGKIFNHKSRDFSAQKLAYLVPSSKYYIKESGSFFKKLWSGPTYEYTYSHYGSSSIIPIDFNNDGKTDLINFKKFGVGTFKKILNNSTFENYKSPDGYYSDRDKCIKNVNEILSLPIEPIISLNYCDLLDDTPKYVRKVTNKLVLIKNVFDSENDFNFIENGEVDLNDEVISAFSFFINTQNNKGLDSYDTQLTLQDLFFHKDHVFTVKNNEFFENRINEIDNGSGVIQQIEYTQLQIDLKNKISNCNYNTRDISLSFPYFIHKQVPSKFMVSKINTLFDDKAITKEYRYENAIQHLDGKGFLGFQKTVISDPYESKLYEGTYVPKNLSDPIFWKININDPKIENQLIETRYGELNGDYFTKSQINYTKYTKENSPNSNLKKHQYLYHKTQEVNHDRIKDITITKTYKYDENEDLLLNSSTTDYNGEGTSITSIKYQPAWSENGHYYNGRIQSTTEQINAYSESFTTKNEYADFNHAGIPLTHRKYGDNTNPITTKVTYNEFGNKTSETISAEGVKPLTTTFGYDDTQRFVTSITNPEGQTATKDIDIYGKIILETSAIDDKIKTYHTYDAWGNPLTSTAYYKTKIAKTTTLHKENLDDGYYSLTTTTPGEPQAIVVFDNFDRKVKTKTQSINGKWVVVDTEYDVYGKKIKVSEPYFEKEGPSLWNTIEYDELNRPIKQTLYTGKEITTCYSGMTVSVDDGQQKRLKTLDVFGNVIYHKDAGGEINYKYYANGTLKEANYDGITVKVEQDGWGNKTRLEDPSAGVYEYTYDALGRKLTETTPKGTTTYTYDDYGKLLSEITEGDHTHLSLQYEYESDTKLPVKIYGSNGKDTFEYETKYDDYHRIKRKIETTPFFIYETTSTFNDFGKQDTLIIKTTVRANGQTVATKVRNVYDNGLQTKLINENTGETLWEVNQVNAKGQTMQMQLGNGFQINQGFNNYFLPQSIAHSKGDKTAISIDYTFNSQEGILLSRNNHIFNKQESFEYDDLHRLNKEILNGKMLNEYGYDKRGRITFNSQIGEYKYNEQDYKIQQIEINSNGLELKENRGFQQIVYNSYKKAVNIHLPNKERIDFDYDLFKDRVAMYYGSEDKDINQRPLRKYYSSDKAVEIKQNLQTGEIEVLTYLDGDPYSANVLQRNLFSRGNNSPPDLWYLHRDYQATILAITNQEGNILEQRYFDAWGNLKEYKNEKEALFVVTDNTHINLILDRGYTSHEHLWGVDLIHMNGRLYDAKLRRFLSPDNFIQDPYNTQNFNRYGYVLNNPLIYTDASGEILGIAALTLGKLLLGVATSVAIKGIMNIVSGTKFWYGLGSSAVSGLFTSYIGAGAGAIIKEGFMKASTYASQAIFKAGVSGMAGGLSSTIQGGDFDNGFVSGAVASLVMSGVRALGIDFKNVSINNEGQRVFPLNNFGKSKIFEALVVVSGISSGGLSSSIAGGSFIEGAINGMIGYGVNKGITSVLDQNTRRGLMGLNPKGTASVGPIEEIASAQGELIYQAVAEDRSTEVTLRGGDTGNYSKYIKFLDIDNTLKQKLIEKFSKDGKLLEKEVVKYYKGLKLIGRGIGFYNIYTSVIKLAENPYSVGNWLRVGVNTFSTFAKADPLILMGIVILDGSGATESLYQWVDDNTQ